MAKRQIKSIKWTIKMSDNSEVIIDNEQYEILMEAVASNIRFVEVTPSSTINPAFVTKITRKIEYENPETDYIEEQRIELSPEQKKRAEKTLKELRARHKIGFTK